MSTTGSKIELDEDGFCKHAFLPDECAICKYILRWVLPPSQFPDEDPTVPQVKAKYEGHCIGCNLPIYPGQYVSPADNTWAHTECL